MSDFKEVMSLIDKNFPEQSLIKISESLEEIKQNRGIQASYNILLRLEVALGFRKPRVAVYDNALHFIGGAQKYGCTLAQALQEDFDVTLIANKKISLNQLQDWYGLDLKSCQIKVIPIPYFEDRKEGPSTFNAGEVDLRGDNPFHVISLESGEYDIFINNCMLEMVYPLSNVSEFICHFPEREKSRFFHVDKYTHIICNSQYTGEWIKKKWDLEPNKVLYPPVDMMDFSQKFNKEKIILSVSRFEPSGKKQQLEMVKIFERMIKKYPQETEGWKIVLAGGNVDKNPYFEKVRKASQSLPPGRIDLEVDISLDELKKLYKKASIFWHLTGFEQIEPERAEHFGMTTVESMQNRCVPIAHKGGGQKEIIEDKINGFFFETRDELMEKTIKLIHSRELMIKIGESAYKRAKKFTKESFQDRVKKHFKEIFIEYAAV